MKSGPMPRPVSETLAITSVVYLSLIPLSWRRFLAKEREGLPAAAGAVPEPLRQAMKWKDFEYEPPPAEPE